MEPDAPHAPAPRTPRAGGLRADALRDGARIVLPLSLGIFPFGIAYGVAVSQSSMEDWIGALASLLMVSGAAQLAIVDLFDQGAPWFVIVGTALVINARFLMYSGALASSFREYPRRWRVPLAHLITDQSTATSLLYNERERQPLMRMSFFLGAAGSFALSYLIGTVLGIIIGAAVPPEAQLGFAVPLMFVSLLVPSVRDAPSLVAASVGFAVTLLARDAPLNGGLLIGAAAGIAFGMLARLRADRTAPLEGEP